MKEAVPLVKNILAPLGITAAVSAIDAGIQKKKKKKKKRKRKKKKKKKKKTWFRNQEQRH